MFITITIIILFIIIINLYLCYSINNNDKKDVDITSVKPLKSNRLSIALHAQLEPNTNNKVVGSVLTTDGLALALKRRFDVEHIEIFYPFFYKDLFSKHWDLIIIEG